MLTVSMEQMYAELGRAAYLISIMAMLGICLTVVGVTGLVILRITQAWEGRKSAGDQVARGKAGRIGRDNPFRD